MKSSWNKWLACGLVAASAVWAGPWASGQSVPVQVRRPRVVEEVDGDFLIRLAEGGAGEAEDKDALPTSDYWIGIALGGELPAIVRQQLGLEHGLAVADVMADSPAAKAKFQTNDILIKAGDANLKGAADLIKAVDAAKERELAIIILRGGKEQTIKVAPIKRPKTEADSGSGSNFSLRAVAPDVQAEIKKLEEALSQLKDKTGAAPLGLMLARPAVVPPTVAGKYYSVLNSTDLPKDVTISITKKSDEPAKIHVEKDGKTWDVTEEKLGDLPEDLRSHVQQFLGHRLSLKLPGAVGGSGPNTIRYGYGRTPAAPGTPVPAARPVPPAPPAPPASPRPPQAVAPPIPAQPQYAPLRTYRLETAGGGGVEGKLDAIMKKLDQLESKSVEQLEKEVKQLRKELDELRGKSPGEKAKGE